MSQLRTAAYGVNAIPEPSKRMILYRDALLHAAQMELLPADAEDRELRQANTRAVALRRLGKLDAEDRAKVEQAGGVLE